MVFRRNKWIVALLFVSTLLNYFDRQILSLVGPVLRIQFSLSAQQYSHLLEAFLLGYTSMQFVAGWVVDRLGARRGLMLAMLWWSAAGTAAGFSHDPRQLALCLFLMGVGEGANWPSAVKAIGEWFPEERRAFAIGIFNAGSSAGAVVAPLVVTAMTQHYSWRFAFFICGVLAVFWLFPWLLLYRNPPYCDVFSSTNTPNFGFLRDLRAWGVILARFFADSIWFFYAFWLPDYLSHVQGLRLAQIGAIGWVPFLAAGLGNLAGGAVSGALIRRTNSAVRARLIVMAVSAVVMASGVMVRAVHHPWPAILVISVVVFAYSAWAANVLTLPADLFPPAIVATVTGVCGTVAGLGGILTTSLIGRILDSYSYGPVFIGISLLPLVALLCSLGTALPLKATSLPAGSRKAKLEV